MNAPHDNIYPDPIIRAAATDNPWVTWAEVVMPNNPLYPLVVPWARPSGFVEGWTYRGSWFSVFDVAEMQHTLWEEGQLTPTSDTVRMLYREREQLATLDLLAENGAA
jgi:hypothetical protein